MVGKSYSQCQKGMSGVRETGGGKYRTAADINIARPKQQQVWIDDTVSGRCCHAHSTHVVIAVVALRDKRGIIASRKIYIRCETREGGERLLNDRNKLPYGVDLSLRYLPVESSPQHTEGVTVVRQGNRALGQRLLLTVDTE